MENEKKTLKSSLGNFLSLMADLILLNLLWILCSIPIVTIGPSTCALFAVMLKVARDESSNTFGGFFKAFKVNFKSGLVLGLIALAAAFVLYVDITFALAQSGTMRTVFLLSSGALLAVFLTYCTYVFALQARYENKLGLQIKNAFLLSLCAPGKTLLMWIIYAVPVAILLFVPLNIVAYFGFMYIMFAVSLPVYFNCKILRNVFDKFVKPENQESNDAEC